MLLPPHGHKTLITLQAPRILIATCHKHAGDNAQMYHVSQHKEQPEKQNPKNVPIGGRQGEKGPTSGEQGCSEEQHCRGRVEFGEGRAQECPRRPRTRGGGAVGQGTELRSGRTEPMPLLGSTQWHCAPRQICKSPLPLGRKIHPTG